MPAFPFSPDHPGAPQSRRRVRRLAALFAPALAAACADLPLLGTSAERVPTRLTVEVGRDRLIAGESTPLRLHVFDQHGRAFATLPPWAAPSWTSEGGDVRILGDRLEAVAPGLATVAVRVAGVEARTLVRINPATLRVDVAAAYVTQAVQRRDGSVPLVAGRPGHLRVFLTGDQPNFFRTTVRAHFFRGGAHIATLTAEADSEGIPLEIAEGELARSWNVAVPGALIQPGAAFLVEADVGPGLPAATTSTLRYPADGVPRALDARTVPRLDLTFVPIHHQGFATGQIHSGNLEQFMAATRQVWPILDTALRIREPYSTPTRAVTEADWSRLLTELRVLWIAEGRTAYYHGILRREGGWAGFAYFGVPVGLTYDQLPNATWTLAHELGHNFNRLHAPCGDPAQIDANFPHANGAIGVFGLTGDGRTIHPPERADLMGYCNPRWVSDYNYAAVMAFRAQEAQRAGAASLALRGAATPHLAATLGPDALALVVAGRIAATGIVIEPAFQLVTRPYLPTPGPFTLEGLDEAGDVLFTLPFAGDVPAHAAGERHFAFAIPLDPARAARLAGLRVRGDGRTAERTAAAAAGAAARSGGGLAPQLAGGPLQLRAAAPGRVHLEWDAARFPLVVVRNPATGSVLALARGGSAMIATDAAELELHLSDGVASTPVRARVAPQ